MKTVGIQPLKILIVDSHPMFRYGLRLLFESQEAAWEIRESREPMSAFPVVLSFRPDLIFLAANVEDLNALDLIKHIHGKRIATRFVCFTNHSEEDVFPRLLELGVKACLLRTSPPEEFLAALKTAIQGHYYLAASFSQPRGVRPHASPSPAQLLPGINRLTSAERRILRLIGDSKTSKEIAHFLGISLKTVENHRANITGKLGLHGSHSLVKFAYQYRDRFACHPEG